MFDEETTWVGCYIDQERTVYCTGTAKLDDEGDPVDWDIDSDDDWEVNDTQVTTLICPHCSWEAKHPFEMVDLPEVAEINERFRVSSSPHRYVALDGFNFGVNPAYYASNDRDAIVEKADEGRWITVVVDLADNEVVWAHPKATESARADAAAWLESRKDNGLSWSGEANTSTVGADAMPAVRSEADEMAELMEGME